jgi:hypothetical protein
LGWGLALFSIQAAHAGVSNLTNSASLDERAPQADASGRAIWSAWDGSDFELFRFDPATSTVTQITNNTVDDRYPQIASNGVISRNYDR